MHECHSSGMGGPHQDDCPGRYLGCSGSVTDANVNVTVNNLLVLLDSSQCKDEGYHYIDACAAGSESFCSGGVLEQCSIRFRGCVWQDTGLLVRHWRWRPRADLPFAVIMTCMPLSKQSVILGGARMLMCGVHQCGQHFHWISTNGGRNRHAEWAEALCMSAHVARPPRQAGQIRQSNTDQTVLTAPHVRQAGRIR